MWKNTETLYVIKNIDFKLNSYSIKTESIQSKILKVANVLGIKKIK